MATMSTIGSATASVTASATILMDEVGRAQPANEINFVVHINILALQMHSSSLEGRNFLSAFAPTIILRCMSFVT